MRSKISQLSEATGLWTVFITYDPVNKKNDTLIASLRHTSPPFYGYLLNNAIQEISTWPIEKEVANNCTPADSDL